MLPPRFKFIYCMQSANLQHSAGAFNFWQGRLQETQKCHDKCNCCSRNGNFLRDCQTGAFPVLGFATPAKTGPSTSRCFRRTSTYIKRLQTECAACACKADDKDEKHKSSSCYCSHAFCRLEATLENINCQTLVLPWPLSQMSTTIGLLRLRGKCPLL